MANQGNRTEILFQFCLTVNGINNRNNNIHYIQVRQFQGSTVYTLDWFLQKLSVSHPVMKSINQKYCLMFNWTSRDTSVNHREALLYWGLV